MQKKKITAKELANKFEVLTRTIYRDIEALSYANIPIYTSKGKDGGIGLLDEYVLNKTILYKIQTKDLCKRAKLANIDYKSNC